MLAYALTPELPVETDRSLELTGQLQVQWENLTEKIRKKAIEKNSQSASVLHTCIHRLEWTCTCRFMHNAYTTHTQIHTYNPEKDLLRKTVVIVHHLPDKEGYKAVIWDYIVTFFLLFHAYALHIFCIGYESELTVTELLGKWNLRHSGLTGDHGLENTHKKRWSRCIC